MPLPTTLEVLNAAASIAGKSSGTLANAQKPLPEGTGSFARLVHQIGAVLSMDYLPCTDDPWILVTLAVEEAARMFYAVEEPDLKEAYHKTLGKSLVCSLKQEINDGFEFKNKFWDGGRKTLFRIAEVADMAVWYGFLASIFVEGLIDWHSQVNSFAGCNGSHGGNLSSSKAQGGTYDISRAGDATGFEWLTGGDVFPAFTPDALAKPGQSWYVILCVTGMDLGGNPVPMQTELRELTSGRVLASGQSIPKMTGGFHPLIVNGRGANGDSFNHQYIARTWGVIETADHLVFPNDGFCAVSMNEL